MKYLQARYIPLLGVIAILAMLVPCASAAPPFGQLGQQPGGGLVINEVSLNFLNDTITIMGEQFDFGTGPLTVTLGTEDISSYCTLQDAQTISCDLSSNSGLPPDGEYLLIVANGVGQSQSDQYDLTVQRQAMGTCASVYQVREYKDNSSNNKYVDAACNPGDALVSCGIEIEGGTGANAATTTQLAGNVTILENRPLGGNTACRARAVENMTYASGWLDRTTWRIYSVATCCSSTPPED